jgi:chromosome segregation ATPase
MVLLESETSTAQQKFMLAEKERLAVQALLDRSLSEVAQLSRRLLDTDNALALTQTRLQHAEAGLAEAQAERARLAAAVDEMGERHRNEMSSQTARLESLEARSVLSDQLLDRARQTLTARAEENGSLERRLAEATLTRDAIETRFGQIEIALADREEQIRHLEHARAMLGEQNTTLARAVQSCEGAYSRAQEQLVAKDTLIELLENQLRAATEAAELHAADLTARLQRERLDRTMAEGALEAGRKDIARLLREIAATKLRPSADASPEAAAPAVLAAAPACQEPLRDAA